MSLDSHTAIQIAKEIYDGASVVHISQRFGKTVAEMNKILSEIFISRGTENYSSTTVLAKSRGIERDYLFEQLINDGMVEAYGEYSYFLTPKGFEEGGRFATENLTSREFWAVWPDDIGSIGSNLLSNEETLNKVLRWIRGGQRSAPPADCLSVFSRGHEDGYLSTSKMAENADGSSKIALPLLERKGFAKQRHGYWTPTVKAITKGAKVRALNDGGWYIVWKPTSMVIANCFKDAVRINYALKNNLEYDSDRKLFFMEEYVPYTSSFQQDNFSEMLLGLKKLKSTSIVFFAKKLNFLRDLDFYICTVPGHDPKQETGIDMLAERMSEEMICRNLSQYFRRRRKVTPQHKLSHSEKRSVSQESKNFKIKGEKFLAKRVLLIDDITTSGNTIKSAKKFLQKNTDAQEVNVLVLGKTIS